MRTELEPLAVSGAGILHAALGMMDQSLRWAAMHQGHRQECIVLTLRAGALRTHDLPITNYLLSTGAAYGRFPKALI